MFEAPNFMQGRGQPSSLGNYDRAVIVFVPAMADIERVPVMPGEKVWVMAMNDAIIGCRTGGNLGTETTYCKMEEYVPSPPPKPEDYVTKADLEDMLSRLLAQQPAPQTKGVKKE